MEFKDYRIALKALTIFNELNEDSILCEFDRLLSWLASDGGHELDALACYHRLAAKLLGQAAGQQSIIGTLWQNYLLESLLTADNVLTRQAEAGGFLLPGLGTGFKRELRQLQRLYRFDWQQVDCRLASSSILDLEPKMQRTSVFPAAYYREKTRIKQSLHASEDWQEMAGSLISFFQKWGAGAMAGFWVFKYDGERLRGISRPDPIRLSNLTGLQRQREQVVANTRQFVMGFSANNMLLYGDRGTGKSSTVKALVHEFGQDGLRLIDVPLSGLDRLHDLLGGLVDRPQRFIIFIDDLSFEEHETQYKELKAILEGGVEVKPENVLIYATSNRRHLVKEYHADKAMTVHELDGGEVRAKDTLQEKLSLADRFGMTVLFQLPNQEEYLRIVRNLAKERGIAIPVDQLEQMALRWELLQNTRSGRTARQFIDYLEGKLLSCNNEDGLLI